MDTDGVVVSRWAKHGKDRLYATGPDGERLGWMDRATRQIHPEDPAHADLLARVFAPWANQDAAPPPPTMSRAEAAAARDALASRPERPVPDWMAGATVAGTAPAGPGTGRPVPARPGPRQAAKPAGAVSDRPPVRDMAAVRPAQSALDRAAELRAQEGPLRHAANRLLGRKTEEWRWRTGAKGEIAVAAALEPLSAAGWLVLHDVPVGRQGANIDHVLIGPAGAVAVNTKAHLGQEVYVGGNVVLVSGHRVDHVGKSRTEAARVGRALAAAFGRPVPVRGLVAVLCGTLAVKAQPPAQAGSPSVHVAAADGAAGWVRQLAPVLDAAALERLQSLARDPRTWRQG